MAAPPSGAAPEPQRSSAPRAYALLTLAALFWSLNMVIGRAMRHDIPPVAMSFWRWFIACLILLPFVAPQLRANWPVIARAWKLLTLLGVIGVTLFNTLCYIALRSTSATNGVLFNSIIPVLIVLVSALFLREPVSVRQGSGVALSLMGVLIIVARGDPFNLLGLRLNQGDLLLLIAMVIWAVYTIALRAKPRELSAPVFLTCIILFGLPPLALAYAVELASGQGFELNAATMGTLAYYGVFPSVLAYLFFNHGVAVVGPSKAGLLIHLVPVFGTLLSTLLLGEPPQLYHLAGVVLVFAGIYLSSTARMPALAGE